MAKISTIKNAIHILRQAKITPFIWGHRGIGKSSAVKQYCEENQIGFIDLRCSQLEASDIRGLPEAVDGKTHYLPPADLPSADLSAQEAQQILEGLQGHQKEKAAVNLQPRLKEGILFLDELNRAADDVLQAVFQLVLDRKVGQYVLPEGWSVVAAGNFMEGYQVNGFNDPAFINRFCHLTLSDGETTIDEWTQYMVEVHGETAASVISFATQNINHLDGDMKGDLGFSILPSRRSWEAVVKIDKILTENANQELRQVIIAGLVGTDMANAYIHYNCPIQPRDIINKGVKPHTKKLKNLSRGQLIGLTWGIVSFAKNQLDDDTIADNCLDFAEFLLKESEDKDIIVAYCKNLATNPVHTDSRLSSALISNPEFAKIIAQHRQNAVKDGRLKKGFVDRITERPELQQILSKVVWGSDQ